MLTKHEVSSNSKRPDAGLIQFWGRPPPARTRQIRSLLSSSCSSSPCWSTSAPHCWWTAPAAPRCLQGAIKSSQMVHRTLLQEIEEVALALLRNVFPFLGVDSIHGHQHPLILAPSLWIVILGVYCTRIFFKNFGPSSQSVKLRDWVLLGDILKITIIL